MNHLNPTSKKKWMYIFLQKKKILEPYFIHHMGAAPYTHLNDKSGLITSIPPKKHQKKKQKNNNNKPNKRQKITTTK